MDAGLLAQYIVVAFAVTLSAAHVVRRQWPDAVRRARGGLALWLMRQERSTPLRSLGRRIAPAPRSAAMACGSSCGGCGPAARS